MAERSPEEAKELLVPGRPVHALFRVLFTGDQGLRAIRQMDAAEEDGGDVRGALVTS
jgi:hypothetical protein